MGCRTVSVAAVLAGLLTSSFASAADWYVDAAAAAGGTGSQANPFSTINAALAGLSRGDTVWIASGTYLETVDVTDLSGSGTTTLRAMPGATPVIDGTSGSRAVGYVVQTSVPDTTFQGLTIQHGAGGALGIQFYYADGGQVVDCVTRDMSANAVAFYYSNYGTVSGCTLQGNVAGRKTTGTVVENNEVYGATAEGVGLYDGSTDCTVTHNVIHDNYSVNLYLDSISHSIFDGNLIYESSASNDLEGIEISDEYYSDLPAPVNSYNTIVNNVVVGHNIGIVFWLSGEWPTQALNDQSGLRYDVISNNTVINNGGSLKWDASPAHVGTTIENNVFAAAAGTSPIDLLQANGAGGIALDHNLWFAPDLTQPFLWVADQSDHAGFVTASGQGSGDVLGNPLFAGSWTVPPATHLELTMTSPAIVAAVSLTAVQHDFLGAPRPATGVDIGAFQYGAVAPTDAGVGPAGDATVASSGDGGGATASADAAAGSSNGVDGSDDGGSELAMADASGQGDAGNGSSPGGHPGCSCSHAGGDSTGEGRWVTAAIAFAFVSRRRRPR